MIERRKLQTVVSPKAGRLEGYAAVYNSESHDLGGFTESIERGAFTRSLESGKAIIALYDHDSKSILGNTRSKTLRLSEDSKGLRFEIDLPETQYAQDLAVLVERGDVGGASFGFRVASGGDRWESRSTPHRTLLDVDLFEITITANPAYESTHVDKRALSFITRPHLNVRRQWLETL